MFLPPPWTRRRAWLSPWRAASQVPRASLALSLDQRGRLSMRQPHSPQCSRLPVGLGILAGGCESCSEGPYTFLTILRHVMQSVSYHCRVFDPYCQCLIMSSGTGPRLRFCAGFPYRAVNHNTRGVVSPNLHPWRWWPWHNPPTMIGSIASLGWFRPQRPWTSRQPHSWTSCDSANVPGDVQQPTQGCPWE